MFNKIRKIIKKPIIKRRFIIRLKNYQKSLGTSGEFKIILGSHWSNHPGWLIIRKKEQDITKPLVFEDQSVDVIFIEHVIEHIDFVDCVFFLREAKRVLKTGGTIRIVSPILERISSVSLENEHGRYYTEHFVGKVYAKENEVLKEMGLQGLLESPKAFFFNSLLTKYGHKFIWSTELLVKVLKSLGYSNVKAYDFDKGSKQEYCINRKRRGLYTGNDYKEDASAGYTNDFESMAIEAIK